MNATVTAIEFIDGRFGVLVNGYQWGNDESLFDYSIGCSSQTWPTLQDAETAYQTNNRRKSNENKHS
jgi:hypothetical protein